MDLWEDELLWDDDFSDEEEELEDLPEDDALELSEDGFADWADSSDGAPEDERLEEALAEERALELESELEQDEHPRDYTAELEDEEEEAAPTSEKRLKREIRAEALRRLEEAARTESDFLTLVCSERPTIPALMVIMGADVVLPLLISMPHAVVGHPGRLP